MENEKVNRTVKSVSIVMVCTLLLKGLGFIRELVLSFFFGTSYVSDAYLISLTIPSVIFEFVGVGMTTCFIPIYYKIGKEGEIKDAYNFTNSVITIVLFFSTICILGICLFPSQIVSLFASGFTGETMDLACLLTKINIFSLILSTYIYVLCPFLHANNRFITPAVSAVISSALVILSIVIGAKTELIVLGLGNFLAIFIRLLFLVPDARKSGLKLRLRFKKNKYIKEFVTMMLPVIIGTSINDINVLIDRTLASRLTVGGIAALSYSNSIIQLFIGGIVQSILTVLYPKLTSYLNKNKYDKASEECNYLINLFLSFLIPITFILVLYGETIISFLFLRGAFDLEALKLTSEALVFYSLGLLFIGIREVLSRVYYGIGDTKTPMVNSSIGFIINVILNFWLSSFMGIKGLALATSISAGVTVVLLVIKLKKNQLICIKIDICEALKILIAAWVSFLIFFWVFRQKTSQGVLIGLLMISISLVFYVISLFVLKTKVSYNMIFMLKKIMGNKDCGKKK